MFDFLRGRRPRAARPLATKCRRRGLLFEGLENRRLLATTYYVDSIAGSDTNAGTSSGQPWATLTKIESTALVAGDAVLLKRNASWNDTLDVARSGTAGQPITFGSYGVGSSPILFRLTIAGDHLVVQDLVVDHQRQVEDAVRIRSSADVTLRNMEIRNGGNDGIDADAADGLLIEGAHIHHFLAGSFTSQADAHGIVVTRTNGVTIRDTEIHHVSGDSFQSDPARADPATTNILIERCHLWTGPLDANFNLWLIGERPGENAIDTKVADVNWDNVPRMSITLRDVVAHGWVRDGFIANRAAFNMKEKIDALFDGVTVYDCEIAFRLRGTRGNADVMIQNAVVYDVEKAIRAEDNLANLRVFNSTFGAGILTQLQFAGGSGGTGSWDIRNNAYLGAKPSVASDVSNQLASAAAFLDSTNRDYHLSDSSSLADTGSTIAVVANDRDGIVRPQGAAYDVGAYEREADSGGPPDIVIHSIRADGGATMLLTYEIVGTASTAFEVGFYRSTAAQFAPGDSLLATISISAAGDLAVGVHTRIFAIGRGTGEIPLPGAGGSETDTDYFLLAVVDPRDQLLEADTGGINEDNVAALTGIYHIPQGQLLIHGRASPDTITISNPLNVTVNGTTYVYSLNDVSSVRIRTHDGDDRVDATSLAKQLFVQGGVGNDTLLGGAGSDRLVGGDGDDLLTGGSGNDSFLFDTDLLLGSDVIDDAAGIDTLNFSATTTLPIVIDLSLNTTQTINAHLSLRLASGSAIENLIGGDKSDLLNGNVLANRLTSGAGDDTLNGRGGNDVYVFDADNALGIDSLYDSAGVDTLDFAATTGRGIVVDLSLTGPQTITTNLTLTLDAASTFENVTGGSKNDVLRGNSFANTLLGAAGDDLLVGGDGADSLTGGSGNDLIVGGRGDDLYLFDADSALGVDTLDESGGGLDWLDFSATTGQSVTLDLAAVAAQVVNSNLTLALLSTIAFENVVGSRRDDSIHGNGLANILVGLEGNDTLHGGGERDLLIGGTGLDLLDGGDDEDLLIAGWTTYDAVRSSLASILAEWDSAAFDYVTRLSHLRTGSSAPKLTARTTVRNDGTATDVLTGGPALDWFFAALTDVTDRGIGEDLDVL